MAKSERNKTIELTPQEVKRFRSKLITLEKPADETDVINKTITGKLETVSRFLPDSFVDLLFLDPPYNLDREFAGVKFKEKPLEEYNLHLEEWIKPLLHTLKPDASIYICGDWRSAASVQTVASKYFIIRNRITWQREKGRGAKANWKSASEDIWFCTMGKDYKFNLEAVKEKRQVIAPYRVDDKPKDWEETADGNFRLTHPSNIWTDITVPYWSMPENTSHPTQKPEKLLAKIILASSGEGDVVFDPFLGSGTTSVTAKKLGRRYVGIELNEEFGCVAEKRLETAESDRRIQGYEDGVFWERNTLNKQAAGQAKKKSDSGNPKNTKRKNIPDEDAPALF